jgi:class 3 adenylate cyclase
MSSRLPRYSWGEEYMESSALCSECRSPLHEGARYCMVCGHEIAPFSTQNERRQLTLLFCDIVGSTELSERLDPEDLRDLLTSYQHVCRDAVGRYEGHISQFLGDGIMSYFGYPVAHEDDAVRAVGAAFGILEGVKLVNQGIGKRLRAEMHVRVGIHMGIAVVGEIGPGGSHDRLAVGETVNLAARIQSSADEDTVVVSATTATVLHGHFELQPLEARSLKGFSRPIELFRVIRPTGARTKFEAAARRGLTPHVGRHEQSAVLARTWDEVRSGADRVVIVRGEAGIGKSRIVHQFRNTALEEPVRVLECICSPLTQATALAPIIAMLEGILVARSEKDPTPQAKLDALRSLLDEHSRFGADALPLVAALLSIPGADESAIRDLSPVRRRAGTLEILRQWLAWAAERVPVALFVEDVHWSDPSTLDLLDLLALESPGGRTLICITARPEFLVRWEKSHVRTIELIRLTGSEIEAVTTYVAGGHALPLPLVRQIAERSEGVPLFVEEMTKAVLESGALRLDSERYELAQAYDGQFVPSSVKASMVARFDRLGESRSVAQLGATIGRTFTYRLIRAVTGMADDKLREHLDRLCRTELAFADGEPPDSVYTFKHALIQDALYETLLKRDRARLHERVFSKLRDEFSDLVESRPEMAAYHAEHAGLRELAIPLLKEAGMRALGRTAMAEAVKHLGRAVELVETLPAPARIRMESDLQAVLGPAYMATLGWAAPEVERSSLRLRDLATAQRDSDRLFQAMWGIWTVHFLRGELDPALDVARQVLEMAVQMHDGMRRVAGHHAVGYTHFYRGEFAEALRHAEHGLVIFDPEVEKRSAAMFQLSLSCAMLCFRTQSQQILGLADQASESLRNWQQLVAQVKHTPSAAYSLCQQCFLARVADDVERVQAWAPECRSLSLAEGFNLWVPLTDIFIAWAGAREGGDAAAAVKAIEASIRLVHASRTYIVESEIAGMLAETLLLAGRPADVFEVAERALEITRVGKQRHYEPELFRLQGDAAKALGNGAQAAGFYREGLASARSMGGGLLELRCALALAKLLGGRDERAELRSVLGRFTEGFDQRDFKNALAFLDARDVSQAESEPSLA